MKFTSAEIRLLRQSRGLGQKQLADRMGIKKQTYCDLENHGNLQPPALQRILIALGFTFESARKFLDALPPPRMKHNTGLQEIMTNKYWMFQEEIAV